MTISVNTMRAVIDAGEAVPRILNEALPTLDGALAKLDDFGAFVAPQPVEKVVQSADGGFAYVTSRSRDLMDMPWDDAANMRAGVRGAIDDVQGILRKVEATGLRKAEAGPAPQSVIDAQAALGELDIAQSHLGQSLRVWAGEFGGAHAQLVPKQVADTADHMAKARRLVENALRSHVNG